MSKQEWIVVGITAALLLAIFLFVKIPWVSHSEPVNPTRVAFSMAHAAIVTYRNEYRDYPHSLLALLPNGNERGIAFLENLGDLTDSWNQVIRYTILKNGFELRSAGPDRTFDTEDDIVKTRTEDTEQSHAEATSKPAAFQATASEASDA